MPRSNRPLTPEQRAEISRCNGAKSQGPTSAAGKERVSRNAIKHGLASHKHIVLDDEMPQAYDELLQAHLNLFDPRNEVEEELVHRMAEATWRMRRAGCMDTAVLNCSRADAEAIAEDHYGEPGLQEIAYLALKESRAEIDSLHRYDTRAMRAYDRALANLVQIRKLFPLAPAEPEPEPEPMPAFATPDVPRVPPLPNKPEEHAAPPPPAPASTGWLEPDVPRVPPLPNKPEEHAAPPPPAATSTGWLEPDVPRVPPLLAGRHRTSDSSLPFIHFSHLI